MSPQRPDPRAPEGGAALILVLIFTVLLYAMVAELVVTARTARLTGENDALLAQMRNHMAYSRLTVEETLLADLQAAAGGGEEGGAGGMPGGGMPGGDGGGIPGLPGGDGAGGAGGEEEQEPEPSAVADGSQDPWYEPTSYSEGDVTTYVWVEDENRKFNLLTLMSPDQEFATESRERFVRLIDALRDGTDFDLTSSDGEQMADRILEWMNSRIRTISMPRPKLKSDSLERPEVSLMLHLDELLLLPGINEEIFFDKVLDSRLIPGLESVLTVYTSLVFDPGNAERNARLGRETPPNVDADAAGEEAGEGAGAPVGAEMPQPEGIGIRININTASRAVLRSLLSPFEMPDDVIEAILRYRNEEEEDDEELGSNVPEDYYGDFDGGEQVRRRMFTDLADLDELPEFQNMADPTVRENFRELVTVQSDVFSVHMASLYRRDEENRVFVLRRWRSVFMRLDNDEDGYLHPLILNEERKGIRVQPIDFYDEFDDTSGRFSQFDQMDLWSQEERAWNPFYLDFYRPVEEREQMFRYQDMYR